MEELGRKLREIREERGIGLEEVQQHTKIRTRYLEAIEEGKLELLPGIVYAKGFVRSYAEYLGLDGQALLEEYGLANESAKALVDPQPAPTPSRKTKDIQKRKPMFDKIQWPQVAAGVGILVVIIAVYALATRGATHSNDNHSDGNRSTHTQVVNNNTAQSKQAPATPPAQAQPKTEPAPPAATLKQTQQSSISITYAVSNVKNLQLQVTADGQCWAQVTSDGKIVFTGMLTQGMTQSWAASQSLVLHVGNSPAIHIQLNGQPVTSSKYTGGYFYTFQLQQ